MANRELAHLGYVVPDMETALKRFVREGATILIPPTADPIQGVDICLLELDKCTHIELVCPSAGTQASPVRSRLARGGGLDHVCYWVADLEAELAQEMENGAIVVCPPCHAVAFATDIAFVLRRSGLVVELMVKQ